MVRAMCGILLKDGRSANDMMLMFDLNETIDRLTVANCVHWYWNVLKSGWSCLEKGFRFCG